MADLPAVISPYTEGQHAKQTTHPPVPAQCGEVNVQPVSTVTVGYLGPPAFISASQAQHEASFAVLLGIVLHSPNQLAAAAVSRQPSLCSRNSYEQPGSEQIAICPT